MFTYIDLFAGGGGLSEGFQREGFIPKYHIEMESFACKTLQTRQAYFYLKNSNNYKIYQQYLLNKIDHNKLVSYLPHDVMDSILNIQMSKDNISDIKTNIYKSLKGTSELDVLVGGPPCQTYSLVGRSVQKDKIHSDSRNYLFELYIDILKEFNPRMFVFENVSGLLSAKNENGILYMDIIKESFDNIGYKFDFKLLNARSFGVLQNRKRVIIIGWRKNLSFSYPSFNNIPLDEFTVSSLFKDLPSPMLDAYIGDIPDYLQKYNLRSMDDILTQHITRTINERDKKIYNIAIKLWKNNQQRLSYDALPSNLVTHKNKTAFLDRFKVVADDISYSQTILAHLSKDGHYYIYPDDKQNRSISVREAARLQSFPDNYFFEGTMTQAFKQIGNAVPPLMSQEIAKKIKEQLNV